MTPHVISQLLYLQILMLKVDSAHARKVLSARTAGLCYKQLLMNSKSTAWYILLRGTLSVTLLPVIHLQFWAYGSLDSLFPISMSPTANL